MAVRRRAYPRRWFLALPAFPVHAAAALAAGGFLLVAVFQIALALGVPWGRGAWGGVHGDVLPARLRIASAVSAGVLVVAALVVLVRVGYLGNTAIPYGVFRWGTWTLVAAMTLSALANFASSSRWERFLGGAGSPPAGASMPRRRAGRGAGGRGGAGVGSVPTGPRLSRPVASGPGTCVRGRGRCRSKHCPPGSRTG